MSKAEKYIDLTNQISRDWGYMSSEAWRALSWLDEHPDQAPGRTITESELRRQIDKHLPDGTTYEQVTMFMIDIGHSVVPDPEPTNAERWREFLSERLSVGLEPWQLGYLVEAMDERGVKAPGE